MKKTLFACSALLLLLYTLENSWELRPAILKKSISMSPQIEISEERSDVEKAFATIEPLMSWSSSVHESEEEKGGGDAAESLGIKHALFINLKSRTDRRREIESELIAANISAIRIPGINISSNAKFLEGCWDGGTPNGRCAGKVGCQLSHLRALEFALNMGWPHVAIFEDDFAWSNTTTPALVQSAVYRMQDQLESWDAIAISMNVHSQGHVEARPILVGGQGLKSNIVRIQKAYTTHGYLIRRHLIRELYVTFRDCDVRSYSHAIDTCWGKLMNSHRWYGLYPQLGTQREGYSDIEGGFRSYNIRRG